MLNEPIRLEHDELFSPKVEAYLEEQAVLHRAVPEFKPRPLLVRIFLSSHLYLSLFSALGAFCAWAMLEPFFDDNHLRDNIASFLLFPTVVGFVGLFLGASEGLMCRNLPRAALSGLIGLAIGFGGGFLALFAGGMVMIIMTGIALGFQKGQLPDGGMPSGLALLIFMMGRASAWAIAAIPAGLGQGVALRSRKVALNGLVGGVLGGLIGGLLFDPINIALARPGDASVSRAVGFTVIGAMVGLFISFVEQWTKTAWVLMRTGPLAGKQFILYQNPAVLGSSPKADIYLFKDEAIEPRHALIHNRGGRYEIEDCNTPDGTYVQGYPIQKRILQSGDQIVLGKTVLEFVLKDS